MQLVVMVGAISENVKPRVLLQGKDDDSSYGVAVAMKTKWWNDNTWYPYGVLYYRVAHSLYHLSPGYISAKSNTLGDKKERGHHFALLLINLISIYVMGWLLACLISKNFNIRLFSVLILAPCFLNHPIWANFLLRAHPELFFALIALGTVIVLLISLEFRKSEFYQKLLGVGIGLSLATKMFFVLFIPGMLMVKLLPNFRKNLHSGLTVLKWSLISYFLIGFPQNFILHKTLRTMMGFGKYSTPRTVDQAIHWFDLLKNQVSIPLLGLFLVLIIAMLERAVNTSGGKGLLGSGFTNNTFLVKILKSYTTFLSVSLLLLFLQSTGLPHEHYVITYTLLVLIWFIVFWLWLIKILKVDTIGKDKFAGSLNILLVLVAVGFNYFFIDKSSAIQNVLSKSSTCSREVEYVYEQFQKVIQEGSHIVADPYTPTDRDNNKTLVSKEWNNSFHSIIAGKTKYLFLNSSYYERYFSDSDYTKADILNLEDVKKFYLTIKERDEFKDVYGANWQKIYDQCHYQIWKVKN